MSFMHEIINLFDIAINSEELAEFLAIYPSHDIGELSNGDQYITSKENGFDLLFRDSPSAPRRHPNYRLLRAAFLYASGADKHKEFKDELPFGFLFQDRRQDLIAKCRPNRTWVIGRGRVPVTYLNPCSDSWHTELSNFHVDYWGDGSGRIHHFQVSPPEPFTDDMAPPTWQELALLPDQRRAAMQLYQKENSVNVVEAKRAVDQYLNEHCDI